MRSRHYEHHEISEWAPYYLDHVKISLFIQQQWSTCIAVSEIVPSLSAPHSEILLSNNLIPSERGAKVKMRRKKRRLDCMQIFLDASKPFEFVIGTAYCAATSKVLSEPLECHAPLNERSPSDTLRLYGSVNFGEEVPHSVLENISIGYSFVDSKRDGANAVTKAQYMYLSSIKICNTAVAACIREEISKVQSFLASQRRVLASAAADCIEAVKHWHLLKKSEHESLLTTYRQVFYSLDNLEIFAHQNEHRLAELLDFFDSVTKQDSKAAFGSESALGSVFRSNAATKSVGLVKNDMTSILSHHATNHDLKKATKLLERRSHDAFEILLSNTQRTLLLGILVGCILVLFLLCVVEVSQQPFPLHGYHLETASYWFSISFVAILQFLLFAVAVTVWEHFNINYAFILGLDPVFHWKGLQLLKDQLFYLLIWISCLYAFLRSGTTIMARMKLDVDMWVWQFVPVPVCILWMIIRAIFDPIREKNRQNWFLMRIWRIVCTPWYSVEFADFFVCGHLRSMSRVEEALQLLWCNVHAPGTVSDCIAAQLMRLQILSLLPALWRMLQCLRRYFDQQPSSRRAFPNLINAAKYAVDALSLLVNMLLYGFAKRWYPGTNFEYAAMIVYLTLRAIVTYYKLAWDIFVDCALFSFDPYTRKFNTRQLLFPKWVYVVFVVVDVLVRHVWIASFTVSLYAKIGWSIVFFGSLDVLRRFLWSIIRVESEQNANVEQYKVTKFAPLPKEQSHTSNHKDVQGARSISRMAVELLKVQYRNISLADITLMARLFALLPQSEKVKMMRIIFAADSKKDRVEKRKFIGVVGEGKCAIFSGLDELFQLHAFSTLIGSHTLAEYCQEVQYEDPQNSIVPAAQEKGGEEGQAVESSRRSKVEGSVESNIDDDVEHARLEGVQEEDGEDPVVVQKRRPF